MKISGKLLLLEKIIIFYLLLSCHNLKGQEKETVFFNQNWEITTVKKATYYRITELDKSGTCYDGKFVDYLVKNFKIIATGEYSSGKKNNEFIDYFENGNIRQKGNYKNDIPTGRWYYYYPDGQVKMIVDLDERDFHLVEYRDSLNRVLLENGTGIWEADVNVNGIPTRLEAPFKDGERNGTWVYSNQKGKKVLIEKFKNSKLVSSEGFDTWGRRVFQNQYLNNQFFYDTKNKSIDKRICETDLNIAFTPLKFVTKILTLNNTSNLSYKNSKLPVDQILCVAEDNSNNTWIGTANHGLIKFDSIFTFYNKKNSPIKGDHISNITVDKNDKVWFSFNNDIFDYDIATAGLACWSNNKVDIYNTKNSGLTCNGINSIAVDTNNKKWFAAINCIISFDELTHKWDKHFNAKNFVRIVDTVKYKNKDEYISYAKQINSINNSYETRSNNKNGNYSHEFDNVTINYTTIQYYESPIDYIYIDILPDNIKLINSIKNGCCLYNNGNWECDTSNTNVVFVNHTLTKKFQFNDSEAQEYMSQLSKILERNSIVQLIKGIDNSIWILTNNAIFKVAKSKIVEFDLSNEDIQYVNDGQLKKKFYYLYQDKAGNIWACINSAILKIE